MKDNKTPRNWDSSGPRIGQVVYVVTEDGIEAYYVQAIQEKTERCFEDA